MSRPAAERVAASAHRHTLRGNRSTGQCSTGHPVALPEPNSDRSWTAVEHGGRRVAAIIHDAELEARPELVEAAAAGAVLAFENEPGAGGDADADPDRPKCEERGGSGPRSRPWRVTPRSPASGIEVTPSYPRTRRRLLKPPKANRLVDTPAVYRRDRRCRTGRPSSPTRRAARLLGPLV